MDHRQHIAAILKDWLQMTHGESQAIRSNDWAALRKVQAAKAALREPLGEALEKWRVENPEEAATNPFRADVAKLLALEEQNSRLLTTLKRRTEEKKRLLEQALFNLRRVRSSYAKSNRLILNSYS
jgi:flagellar biosynthesis/type III secretory pathway chaperone